MTERAKEPQPEEPQPKEPKKEKGFTARMAAKSLDAVLDRVIGSLDEKDRKNAAKRVDKARKKNPEATPRELADILIKKKCKRTAAVGAVTAMPATIPGVGTATALIFGSAADLAITAGMQAELVLEIADCFEVTMTPTEERTAILTTTGVGAAAGKVVKKVGEKVAQKAGEQLAKKSIARSLPLIGMGAAAGTNMVTTYGIGKRAVEYFSLGPDRLENWSETSRALTGVDERKMVEWLSETGESSRRFIGDGVDNTRNKVVTVSKATGELVVDKVSSMSDWMKRTGNAVAEGVGSAGEWVTGLFQSDKALPEGEKALALEAGDTQEPPPLPPEALGRKEPD